jgi:hypothetical protein
MEEMTIGNGVGKEQCNFSGSVFVLPQNGCSRQKPSFLQKQ